MKHAARQSAVAAGLMAVACAAVCAPPTPDIGEAIYLRGEASPGRPVAARHAAGGWRLGGSVVACANCHGQQREGGREGAVPAPSLRWVDAGASARQQLRAALAEGIGRDGRRLDPTMPRFELGEAELDALQRHLALANAPGHRDGALPLYVTLMPQPALRLPDESALLEGLQRCFAPLASSAAPVLRWKVLEHASPQQALAHWRDAAGDAQVAAIVAPSLRGWKDRWLREVQAAGPAAARWPSIVFPLVDDPLDLDAEVPVHWLFGGAREREAVLLQVWQQRAGPAEREASPPAGVASVPSMPGASAALAGPRWTAVPARSGAATDHASISFGALWAEATCATVQAAHERALKAPGGLAREPARRVAWALQRMGRMETTQGLALEPGRRIAVNDWAVWELAPAAAPRLIEPRVTPR